MHSGSYMKSPAGEEDPGDDALDDDLCEAMGPGPTEPRSRSGLSPTGREHSLEILRRQAKRLHEKGKRMIQRSTALQALADQIEEINKHAAEHGTANTPHIGAGSLAEQALYELVTSIRGEL
jgi:hypothetical protein